MEINGGSITITILFQDIIVIKYKSLITEVHYG